MITCVFFLSTGVSASPKVKNLGTVLQKKKSAETYELLELIFNIIITF